jgi:uncharacterized protein with ParB-like and HNH nuclease domain
MKDYQNQQNYVFTFEGNVNDIAEFQSILNRKNITSSFSRNSNGYANLDVLSRNSNEEIFVFKTMNSGHDNETMNIGWIE